MIINYVKNQKEHHKKETFHSEFKRLLIEMELNSTRNIYCDYSDAFNPFEVATRFSFFWDQSQALNGY